MEFDPKWLTDPQVFQVNRLPAHASYMVRRAVRAPHHIRCMRDRKSVV